MAVSTHSFHDLALSAGVTGLLPVTSVVPLLLTAGGLVDEVSGSWHPGVMGNLLIAIHSFDYESTYTMTNGLFVEWHQLLDQDKASEWILGAQVDSEIIALPALALINLFR